MCHLIFWPNFSIIDQHLVLVWCNLHVFLTIFTALYGWNNLFFRDVMLQMGLIYPQLFYKTYAKLKKSLRLVVLGYTWYFLIWGGLSLAPNPGKLKFLIGFLSKSSQYNINVWYELSFLWKSEPDWWSLSGVLTDVSYDHPLDTCTSNTCILNQLCIS